MASLTFNKNAKGTYEAKTSVGSGDPCTIQLVREQAGFVRISGNLAGFEPEEIAMVGGNVNRPGFLKKVDWPNGVVLTIESETPVTKGAYE